MFAERRPRPAWTAEDEERSLAILCQALLAEIEANASPEQRRGLLVAVGRRLAALLVLPAEVDLGALDERINQFWGSLAWGSVGLEVDDRGIDIVHRGLPIGGQDQLQDWEQILPAVLEGAYAAWFEQIGGPSDRLRTWVVEQRGGEIELRHGL